MKRSLFSYGRIKRFDWYPFFTARYLSVVLFNLTLLLSFNLSAQQQGSSVSGTVTDGTGETPPIG